MADVHRLGDVGRTEIDHDAVGLVRERATPSRSSCKSSHRLRRHRLRLEGEIDETGAGDRRRFAPFPDLEMLDDLLRERARIFSALLRQDERGVRLIIAEARVGRGRDFAGLRQVGRGERGASSAREKRLKVSMARDEISSDPACHPIRRDAVATSTRARERSRESPLPIPAVARLSRTERSFRNLAIEARVRR